MISNLNPYSGNNKQACRKRRAGSAETVYEQSDCRIQFCPFCSTFNAYFDQILEEDLIHIATRPLKFLVHMNMRYG